jgi:cytochrome c biogenesis protein
MFGVMKRLGVFDPYHSWWYTLILAILTLLLIACSIRRLKGNLRAAFGKSFMSSAAEIKSARNARVFEMTVPKEQSLHALKRILMARFFRVHAMEQSEGVAVFADRWGVSRLGSFLMHSGLVVAVVGAVLASLLGYSVYRWGGEGDLIAAPDARFEVRVDGFEIQLNEAGEVKDYISTLTVMAGGESLLTKAIEVNHPLQFKGFNFYQSSYRPEDRNFDQAVIAVRDTAGKVITMVKVEMGQRSSIPSTPYSLQPVDFAGNFIMRGKEVLSDPQFNDFRNPAVKVILFNQDKQIREGWIFNAKLAGFHSLLNEYRLEVVDVKQIYETGLRITRNPGSTWIWVGLVIMTIGVCITFFLSHRKIWCMVQPLDERTSLITLCGSANRNSEFLDKQLKRIEDILRQGGRS